MSDDRRAGPITLFWAVPCAYGLLLIGASMWWLATGEPFDQDTYTRIGGSAWSAIDVAGCLSSLLQQQII